MRYYLGRDRIARLYIMLRRLDVLDDSFWADSFETKMYRFCDRFEVDDSETK